jgi:diguanylate cyclase (GGDEF)-like protein
MKGIDEAQRSPAEDQREPWTRSRSTDVSRVHRSIDFARLATGFLEEAPVAVVITDQDGRIVLLNHRAEMLFHGPSEALAGRSLASVLALTTAADGLDEPLFDGPLIAPSAQQGTTLVEGVVGVPVEVNFSTVNVDGEPFTLGLVRDVSASRQRVERLMYRSNHDALTGLMNRHGFEDALLRLDRGGPHPVGVVVVDLDGFKHVNDARGHAAGDALLRRAAQLLRLTFRASDVVARIGGDEFAVLTVGRDVAAIEALALRLEEAVTRQNDELAGSDPLRVSVGVSVALSGGSLSAALHDADTNMYRMKRVHQAHAAAASR